MKLLTAVLQLLGSRSPAQRRKESCRCYCPRGEGLEQRLALSGFSLAECAELVAQVEVTGVTILTHGYQVFEDGDALIDLGRAIRNKADQLNGNENAWLLDYDASAHGGSFQIEGSTESTAADDVGHVLLLFDWAVESNEVSNGWGEAAGDALFSILVGLNLVSLSTATSPPLHFIGQSFGAAVTSEAVERLAALSVPVDQVTFLDPHDFDQNLLGIDSAQQLWTLGEPHSISATAGYGATVWSNVAFADVYYQTRGLNGALAPDLTPKGRPLPGAFNVLLDTELPASYDAFDATGDHTYVWNTFYLSTVLGELAPGASPPLQPVDYMQTGFAFSRVADPAAANRPSDPSGAFFSTPSDAQDHQWSSEALVMGQQGEVRAGTPQGGIDTQAINEARFDAAWNPLTIINGSFDAVGNAAGLIPGWSNHGSGGTGDVVTLGAERFLQLDSADPSRTHNRLLVPLNASHLAFNYQRTIAEFFGTDQLTVRVRPVKESLGQAVLVIPLTAPDAAFQPHALQIPRHLRGEIVTIEFALTDLALGIASAVRIDDVRFEDRALPDTPSIVTGADAGGGPHVRVFDPATHQERFGFFAYNPTFTGGVRVATGDINGDGTPDIIAGAGPGGGPHVRVFDGHNGTPLAGPASSFFAYDPNFSGGVFVASGDVNADGRDDIITGAGAGGGPHVKVFSGLDGAVLFSFFAYQPAFGGGVSVAVGDVNGDGRADVITGAGPGGGPHVRVFSSATAAQLPGAMGSFFAYAAGFAGGVYVAAGDINGDGHDEVYTGAGAGGGPHVRVFSGANRTELLGFFAYDADFRGGVRVAAADLDADGRDDIITAPGPGGEPRVRGFSGENLAELTGFVAYNPAFTGGVFAAIESSSAPAPATRRAVVALPAEAPVESLWG